MFTFEAFKHTLVLARGQRKAHFTPTYTAGSVAMWFNRRVVIAIVFALRSMCGGKDDNGERPIRVKR
jgi:hypothetical protein